MQQAILDKNAKKFSRFEYVGGYTGSGGFLYLLCSDCGSVFRFNAQITRPSNKVSVLCPHCTNVLKDTKKKVNAAKKETAQRVAAECAFIKRFNERYGNSFEYISGYDRHNTGSKIAIRCKCCGSIKNRSRSKLFDICGNIECKACGSNRKGVSVGYCARCGNEYKRYSAQQVLCKECHDAVERECNRSRRSTAKRMREARAKANGKIDYSITLARLIERDNSVCKLCGREVNENDYVYVGDTFVAGNDYPSIDHIKPLSKGGVHQWNNVQLAHRLCNSLKCNKDV